MSYIAIHPSPNSKKPKRHPFSLFDKIVLIVSVMYPLSALPQAIAVFYGHTAGVSILSWGFFMLSATLFLVYGIRRKVLPMIISNSIWVLMDGLVVLGIVLHAPITMLI